jgi:hypothetical protein
LEPFRVLPHSFLSEGKRIHVNFEIKKIKKVKIENAATESTQTE